MNRINPNKLHLSKWTAVEPKHKRKHFVVTEVLRDDDERVTHCVIEAVIDRYASTIDWTQLQDTSIWVTGWK